jgi:uncharacterized membrane protein
MTPDIRPEPPSFQELQNLNTIGTISYVLHLIVAVAAVLPGVQASVLLLIVALLLDILFKEKAHGTWHASHFRWRIRSVLIAGFCYLVTSPLFLLLFIPGWIAWFIISAWFLYRIIKGFIAMNNGRDLEMRP